MTRRIWLLLSVATFFVFMVIGCVLLPATGQPVWWDVPLVVILAVGWLATAAFGLVQGLK